MTALHALFVRRVREEMKSRGLNPHKLEEYGVKQRTLADVLRGADPRLSTISSAATALGMKAADLLREGATHRAGVVVNLPRRNPSMFGDEPHTPRGVVKADKDDRKRKRR